MISVPTRSQRLPAAAQLHVELDAPLPAELWDRGATAVFVCGWCFHREERIRELELVLDGSPQRVMAHGMPRLDPFRLLHPDLEPDALTDPGSAEDPLLHSYASGFWGVLRIDPRERRTDTLEPGLRATLASGARSEVTLGSIQLTGRPAPVVPVPPEIAGRGGPLVAICMATHNPPEALLRRQLDSIRQQSHDNWICLISDDCSRPDRYQALQDAVGGDPRFVVSRSDRRLGFYRNFERALAMVPAAADYVALADQDDFWYPGKLTTLLGAIGSASLVYSDARVISSDSQVLSDTYWSRRQNNYTDLLSLLVANSVTGAASLLRRDLLDDALPFPPGQFAHYHDHWLALVALTLGRIAFVDLPLYDYVQHDTATLGHDAANRMASLRERLAARAGDRRERVRMWRMHYFVDGCRLLVLAAILNERGGPRISPAKRRVLRRFQAAEHSPVGLAQLWYRGVCELLGRRETLGAEWVLFRAFSWRRMLTATARERPQQRLRLDAVPPSDLAPGARGHGSDAAVVRSIAGKIAPLDLAPSGRAPERLNLLIPTIDLPHFFGGYIAKFNLARRLAQRGARIRIVTVDPVGQLPRNWRRQIESYSDLSGLFERVELAFGRGSGPLEVNPRDRFVATTWWTAHIASDAGRTLGTERFLYLIQEYEPFTFPMGTYAALAEQSYRFEHFALFSTELLRGYFRAHGLGVYAGGAEAGDQASAAFENAITRVPAPSAAELSQRRTRRLLFYARPEPHAARNMFELGVLGLSRAIDSGALSGDWELNGIGSVQARSRIELPGDAALSVLPRADQDSYAQLLRDHDVGLALMYTPHPSLVPIEMASAGMLTVTNTFENKTAEAMADISSNLIAVEPSVQAVAEGLRRAAHSVEDFDRRARGTDVRWSRDWNLSFPDAVLERVERALEMSR
jgi:glycosyltransferase involved in cell wall biosynthesis